MRSASMSAPVATATGTRTSIKTYLAIATIGGASFAAAMFMAAARPATLLIGPHGDAGTVHIVEGDDAILGGFEFAAQNDDVIITDLAVNTVVDSDGSFATVENDAMGDNVFTSCVLKDSATQNILAGPAQIVRGILSFNDQFTVTRNAVLATDIVCDTANMPAHQTPFAASAFLAVNNSVVAETAGTGNLLMPNQVFVGRNDAGINLNQANQLRLWDHGDLAVELAPDSPNSDILVANAANVVVGKWKLHSIGEGVQLEKLTFELDEDAENNIVTAHLALDNGPTQTTVHGFMVGREVVFRPNFDVLLSEDTTLTLSVDTAAPSLFVGGTGTSGERVRFSFDSMDVGSFEGAGTTSGHSLTENDLGTKVAALPSIYRYTKPTVTLSSRSPSGFANAGLGEVLRFNVMANNAEDLTISSFAFKVNSTDENMSNWNDCTTGAANAFTAADFTIYNFTNDGTAVSLDLNDTDWTLLTPDRTVCSTTPTDLGYVIVQLPEPEYIQAGQSYEFRLYVDTTGASASFDDTIRFDIPETGRDDSDNLVNGIVWDDRSGQYISGYLVRDLPVNGGQLYF